MSKDNHLNRRRFMTVAGSIATVSLAGCADNGNGDNTPAETPTGTSESTDTQTDGSTTGTPNESETATTTEDALAPDTPRGTPDEFDGQVIDSLEDYRYVANNEDEWVGKQVRAENVSYYDSYKEDYQGFRALYNNEKVARPFFLKTTESFKENEKISFTGTVERVDTIQDVNVLVIEDVTIERLS